MGLQSYTNCGIYSITFENGKRYVGQSVSLRSRKTVHLRAARSNDLPVYRAMRKYSHVFETLCYCSPANLSFYEKLFIEKLGTTVPSGYNLTYGGEGGVPLPEVAIRQTRHFVGVPKSVEHRQKIGDARRGIPQGPMSEAQKKKIGDAQRGKSKGPFSKEHRENISKAKKGVPGRKMTDDEKLVSSLRQKGKKRPPFSDEWRKNMSKSRKGKSTGPFTDARRHKMSTALKGVGLGVPKTEAHRAAISAALKGKKKTPETVAKIIAAKKANKEKRLNCG